MSADDDGYTDGTYDDAYDDAYDDDAYDEDDAYDSSLFPFGWGAGWGWGWPTTYGDADDDAAYGDETYGDDVAAERDEKDSWWDEGLISLLLVGGVVLFLLPEPITSTIGIFSVAAGVILWVADALS